MRDDAISGQELGRLLQLDEDARLRRLDRRQPASPDTNWWSGLLLSIDLHALERRAMLDSRRAKNLVSAAERHLANLDDPVLAYRLRAWLAIKPRLV